MPSFLKLQCICDHFPAVNSPKILALFSRSPFLFTEAKDANIGSEKHPRTKIVKGNPLSLDVICFIWVANLA